MADLNRLSIQSDRNQCTQDFSGGGGGVVDYGQSETLFNPVERWLSNSEWKWQILRIPSAEHRHTSYADRSVDAFVHTPQTRSQQIF